MVVFFTSSLKHTPRNLNLCVNVFVKHKRWCICSSSPLQFMPRSKRTFQGNWLSCQSTIQNTLLISLQHHLWLIPPSNAAQTPTFHALVQIFCLFNASLAISTFARQYFYILTFFWILSITWVMLLFWTALFLTCLYHTVHIFGCSGDRSTSTDLGSWSSL